MFRTTAQNKMSTTFTEGIASQITGKAALQLLLPAEMRGNEISSIDFYATINRASFNRDSHHHMDWFKCK